jgi:hypothetical protein
LADVNAGIGSTSRVGDGINDVSILAADFNGLVHNDNQKTMTFTSSGVGAQTIGPVDCRGYSHMRIYYTAIGTGLALTGQWCPISNGTFVAASTFIQSGQTNAATANLGTTNNMIYESPVMGNYFQFNLSALTVGPFTGYIILSTMPHAYHTMSVAIGSTGQVAGNTATAATFPTNPFAQGLKALTASPTVATANNLVAAAADVMGNALVATGGLVTTAVAVNAANTVVKAGAGRLCNVLVTTTGTNPMLIYDNATTNSGTVIGCLPASPPVGTTYTFSMPAAAGITVAGSATNPAVTISWI